MSSEFEKLIAKNELGRRRLENIDNEIKRIESLSDSELEKILKEPDDEEGKTNG